MINRIEINGTVAKDFFNLIHDVNQEFKSIYGNKAYYIIKGLSLYSYNYTQLCQVLGEININQRKIDVSNILEELEKKNFCIVMPSKEFFDFHKDYKKNVSEIIIDENSISILTDIPDLIFKSMILPDSIILNQMNIIDSIIEENNHDNLLCDVELPYDTFIELKENNRCTNNLFINIESAKVTFDNPLNESHILFKTNLKFFPKITQKDTLESRIKLYDSKQDEKIYVVELYIKNKKYTVRQFYKIIDI